MTGAMAGSTATIHRSVSSKLKVITVTINNLCNMRCPHCYLQYEGPDSCVDVTITDAIASSHADHIAIVGKEPLVNSKSVAVTEDMVARCALSGKSVSLVTNGVGLNRLSSATLTHLDWIDVSMDGGPATYSRYRQGSFELILRNVHDVVRRGAQAVIAMHTVSSLNLCNIDDMMGVAELAPWDKIVFSPYAEVRNHGTNATSPVPFSLLLESLKKCNSFLSHSSAFLLIGSDAFLDQELSDIEVCRGIEAAGLSGKVLHVRHNPLELGYMRVTYDGYVMTPYQSLNPADYQEFATPLQQHGSVDAAFRYLRAA